MSCLKEADVLKRRGQVVSNMQKKDHAQLWLGLQNGTNRLWATLNERLSPVYRMSHIKNLLMLDYGNLKKTLYMWHHPVLNANCKVIFYRVFLFFVVDKFDQFWAVNRKLMELPNDCDHFKYVPFRCYLDDGGYKQKLIKPMREDGRKKTLGDLLQEVFSNAAGDANNDDVESRK